MPVRFHLGEEGVARFRVQDDARALYVPRCDALWRFRQQSQDRIDRFPFCLVPASRQDLQLLGRKPISDTDCLSSRVEGKQMVMSFPPVQSSVKADCNPPSLFIPSCCEDGHIPEVVMAPHHDFIVMVIEERQSFWDGLNKKRRVGKSIGA